MLIINRMAKRPSGFYAVYVAAELRSTQKLSIHTWNNKKINTRQAS